MNHEDLNNQFQGWHRAFETQVDGDHLSMLKFLKVLQRDEGLQYMHYVYCIYTSSVGLHTSAQEMSRKQKERILRLGNLSGITLKASFTDKVRPTTECFLYNYYD